ncbi:MAG: CbtA family protein [Actinomycetes bacterium]
MRSPFLRGALSGAAAGLLAATVAFFALEPVLREAIALEGGTDDGLVSRSVQERLGAPIGFVLTGVAFGLVLAAVDRGVRPGGSPWTRSLVLAGALFTAVVAVPQLRYPPNPPGVGDPETIGDRTGMFLLAVALGIAVVGLVLTTLRRMHDAHELTPGRQVAVVAGGLAVVALAWVLLPGSSDPGDVPAALVWDFRIRSLGVSALLWAALGATYGALALRAAGSREQRTAVAA